MQWTISWAYTPYGLIALFFIAFAESSFFPIPPDILLIYLSIINPYRSFLYALIATFGSVIGGALGYIIGVKGGKPLIEKFVSKKKIELVHDYFERYEEWAIGIAGFTPLPYKLFTISAGIFYINFRRFIVISFLSRGGRFFLVSAFIFMFGERIKFFLYKHFDLFTILLFILLIGGYYFMRRMARINGRV
jgi:membrane protein YqaA with SNARE-associated domain